MPDRDKLKTLIYQLFANPAQGDATPMMPADPAGAAESAGRFTGC
ncbi:hypothetical protein [Bosea sp. (in: a-proteobacteria)]|nr:hypothetical protein [Bosea sp. (in: a-proteobacteria)]MDP3258440.1 hypothetical protein [Bosea sp. (in: a-proteobacteria)]